MDVIRRAKLIGAVDRSWRPRGRSAGLHRLLIMVLIGCGCGMPSPKPSKDQNGGAKTDAPTTAANPAMPKPKQAQVAGTYVGEWSEPVDGLSARLLVTLQGGTHSSLWASPVILEVKNTNSTPLAFIDQPVFTDSAIRDSDGKTLPVVSHNGNQLTGEPQWAVIPGNTYLGIRVDTSIPVHYGLCFGLIVPEAHSLTATLVAQHRDGPKNQWIGEIHVPPVSLVSKSTDR